MLPTYTIWVYNPSNPYGAWRVECDTVTQWNLMKMHYSEHPTLDWSYHHPLDHKAL